MIGLVKAILYIGIPIIILGSYLESSNEYNKKILVEHKSIEGFVSGIEVGRFGTFNNRYMSVISFEDGRVKYLFGLPDMVQQGVKNKITYKRTFYPEGTFTDEIEGMTSYPKEDKK